MTPPELPRYLRRSDAPRDLRPAVELTARGYRALGPARAEVLADGRWLTLYSTSEARARRDGMWRHARQPGGGGDGRLAALLASDFVVLDSETTGLGRQDEVIELAVVDAAGTSLLETRVWPHSGQVPPASTRVHGLTIDDLRGAPTWPEVLPQLRAVVRSRRVLAWNAPFDERLARQSSGVWGLRHDLPAFECAMRAYAAARGSASGRSRLATAAAEQGLLARPQRHRSADDARLALAVLRSLLAQRR